MSINRDRLHGVCKQFTGMLKEAWGRLARDPMALDAGARDRLAGRKLKQRGMSQQVADVQLEEFRSRNRHWSDLSKR